MRMPWHNRKQSLDDSQDEDLADDNTLKKAVAEYGEMAWQEDDLEQIKELPSPLVRLANHVIYMGLKHQASDIHLEPNARALVMRLRIDGVLTEHMIIPRYITEPLITRFQVMTGLNPQQSSIPRSGEIRLKYDKVNYSLRCHFLPTLHGEKIVLHITKQTPELLGLSRMGMIPEVQAAFEETLLRPGLLLVGAHSGSGKTTTQLSGMMRLNSREKNLFVIGRELEYEMDGVSFVKVNPNGGMMCEQAIDAVRAQQPDAVMIDLLSDPKSWEAALDLAHSGALVLAATSAQDAPHALWRLRSCGIARSLIASSLSGVLAQKLVRRVCPHCVSFEPADADAWRALGLASVMPAEPTTFARPNGCEHCRNTGYMGRVGVFELLLNSANVADAVVRCDDSELVKVLRKNRWKTFSDDLVVKLSTHVTTPEEVKRVFSGMLLDS